MNLYDNVFDLINVNKLAFEKLCKNVKRIIRVREPQTIDWIMTDVKFCHTRRTFEIIMSHDDYIELIKYNIKKEITENVVFEKKDFHQFIYRLSGIESWETFLEKLLYEFI